MSNKTYVIRRKISAIKPTPVPESTYRPPSTRRPKKSEPIQSSDYFNDLSRPKPQFEPEPHPEIPRFMNPPPTFEAIDFRVTHAQLQRDEYLMDRYERLEKESKENEPTEFFNWQRKCNEKDEEKRRNLIIQRHKDLDDCSRRAKKAKKDLIERQLRDGTVIREEIRRQLEQTQEEIDAEREEIKKLKALMVDRAPRAVARVTEQKRAMAKQMKMERREDIRAMNRRQNEENARIKENADKIREAVKNHQMTVRGKFKSKVEITDTKFLADLTDEEADELRNKNKEIQLRKVQDLIEKHRAEKDAKINHMVELLQKESEYREQKEIEHQKRRAEQKAQKELEERKKKEEEDKKMLELEIKLEKKRKARIREAEEAEEHMRAIQARNRYLALNKKAQTEKGFKSKQDGCLRTAKERQNSMLKPNDKGKLPQKTTKKNTAELINLKGMLGL